MSLRWRKWYLAVEAIREAVRRGAQDTALKSRSRPRPAGRGQRSILIVILSVSEESLKQEIIRSTQDDGGSCVGG